MEVRGSRAHLFLLRNWRELGQRLREQGRPTLSWTLRLTVAATAAYVVALQFFDHPPLLAPLSALLVTQLTLFSVLRTGIVRVVAVIAGVLIALLFASALGLTWWSLSIIIGTGILIGHLLRLGDHIIEVPVTAMFIMAVQVGTTTAAIDRVYATVIGAAVGLLINVLLPPSERSPNAAAAVRRYAEDISSSIRTALEEMDGEITREQSQAWLTRARALDYKTVHIDRMIDDAEETRVLNVRAIGTADLLTGLRTGLYSLEHSAVTVRGVFRGIRDAVWYPDESGEDALPEGARDVTRRVLEATADVINEFGFLVEAHIYGRGAKYDTALHRSLDSLRAARLAADRRLESKVDPVAVRELLAFVVVAAGRILREFDLRSHGWLGLSPEPDRPEASDALRAKVRRGFVLKPPSRRAPDK